MTTAQSILNAAAGHMQARAATYDKPEGERSMGKAVQAFNAIAGRDLSEAEGWLLLAVLKNVRLFQRPGYHADSAEDAVAYGALLAEAKAREVVQPAAVPYIGTDRRKTTCKDHLPVGDADADGWIKWEGGECPVPYGTRIDVEYRSGARAMDIRALVRKLTGRTATHWEHINCSSDTVAYRLSKEASHAEEVRRAIAEIDAQDVPYIGPDRRACGNDLDDMVRAGKSVLAEDCGACGNVGREA